MIDGYDNGGRGLASEVANWRDCDAFERAIEVPMLEPMRIAGDDRRFIAIYVIGVIAVTVRVVTLAVAAFVAVMVRFVGSIVMMDVRIVSSAMPMMNDAHDARSISNPCLSGNLSGHLGRNSRKREPYCVISTAAPVRTSR